MHPADLDDAFCSIALAATASGAAGSGSVGSRPALPFATEATLLQGASGQLWAAVERQQGSGGAACVRLGALVFPPQAQVDGFVSRELRAEAPKQRLLYATSWCALGATHEGPRGAGRLSACSVELGHARTGRASARNFQGQAGSAVVGLLSATQASTGAADALSVLETALGVIQAQTTAPSTPPVVIVTECTQASRGALPLQCKHGGVWG